MIREKLIHLLGGITKEESFAVKPTIFQSTPVNVVTLKDTVLIREDELPYKAEIYKELGYRLGRHAVEQNFIKFKEEPDEIMYGYQRITATIRVVTGELG